MKLISPILLAIVFFLSSFSIFSQVTVAYVTDTADSGAGTLRDAIENSGEDTVIIDIAGELKLETRLSLSNDVVIIGPSPIHFQIDLSNLVSTEGIFKFNGKNLSLAGVAIEDGNNSRPFELSTTNFPGNITIRDCLFENNRISGNGAVFNILDFSGKTLQISKCSFFDNQAENIGAGGVIYSESSTGMINIYNSTFHNNIGSAGGGAIRIKGGKLNAVNNTFYNNSIGTGSGTAINFNSSAVVTLKNNIFQANSTGLVVDNGGLGLALGSENNFTNRDITQTPVPTLLLTEFTIGANLDLNANFITDGFGLKYFLFNGPSGDCIDSDLFSSPIEEYDARRSWRAMFSDPYGQPSGSFPIDAGAIEYTPFVVSSSVDDASIGSLTSVFEDYININVSNPSKYSIVFEIPNTSLPSRQILLNQSYSISPQAGLIINGFSQEGSRVPGPKNSLGVLQHGIMGVEFDGSNVTSGSSLDINTFITDSIYITGVSFTNNSFGSALNCLVSGDISIEGNHFGVDIEGLISSPNRKGISVGPVSTPNGEVLNLGVPLFMNGYNHNARNIISSNTDYQVGLKLSSNVQNNFIGLSSDGSTVFSSASKGVFYGASFIDNSIGVKIGGEGKKEANYIAGQDTAVYIKQAYAPLIMKNYVGFLYNKIGAGNNKTGLVIEECIYADIIYNQIGNCLNGNDGNAISLKNSDITYVISNAFGIALDSSTAAISGSGVKVIGAYTNENNSYSVKGGNNLIEGNTITNSAVSGINYSVADFLYFGSLYQTEPTSFHDTIRNNIIGYDTTGNNQVLSNGKGILINDIARSIYIHQNIIARNTGAGVAVSDSSCIGIEITKNAIFDNDGLGIDLDNNSLSNITNTNKPQSNSRLIPPEILNAIYCNGDNTINLKVRLNIPDATKDYKVEFFTVDSDGTEGKKFVKDTTFTSGLVNGVSELTLIFPVSSIAGGQTIVATLTEFGSIYNPITFGDELMVSTSEFGSSFTIGEYAPTLSVFDASICVGDSTALTFENYGTFQNFVRSNLNLFQTINDSTYYFFGASPGTGSLSIIVDSLGCTVSLDTTFIKYTGPSSAGLSTINPSCNGDTDGSAESNPIGGTAPFSYEWNSNSPISNNIYNSLSSGTYTVKVIDANNCSVQESFQIVDPTPITFSLNPSSPNCYGGTGSITVFSTAGGTPPYTYSIDNGSTYQNQTTFNGLLAASYSIQVMDANGCITSNSTTINQPPLIRDTVSQTVCDGVTVTQGTSTYSTTGIYTDTLTATNNGCDSIVVLNLIVEALPTVNVGPDTSICFSNTFELLNRSSTGDWQTTTGISLSTSTNVTINSDTSFINQVTGLNCSNTDEIFISVLHTTTGLDVRTACGSYDWIDGNTYNSDTTGATFTLVGSNGCDSIVTLNLTINSFAPAKPLLQSSLLFCEGQSSILLDSEPSNQGIEHFFFYGATQDTSSTHVMSVSGLTASNDSLYAFVGNSFGCLSDTAVTAIDFVSKFVNNSSYFEICEEDSVEFQFNNPNNILDSIKWQVNNSSSFEDTSIIVVNPAEVGLYSFSIFSNGCEFKDSVEVALALNCDEADQITTNAFSPNGGVNINTTFIIDLDIIDGPEMVAVTIYNRWGDIIYKTNDYDNSEEVWDGTNQSGKMMPEGTYFYVVECQAYSFTTSGWVYLDLKN